MQPQHQIQKRMADHSMLRARERSGIWLESDLFEIKRTIQRYMSEGTKYSNKILLLYREKRHGQFTDKYHFLIEWRSKYIWVVWNNLLQNTNTFLPIDGLIHKLTFMTNSVVGFLMAKKLVDIDQLKRCEVVRVIRKPTTNRSEILNNDSYWDNHQPETTA